MSIANDVYEVLKSLRTTQQVADMYGISRQNVNTKALRLRKTHGMFGYKLGRGTWVFTPEEVEMLKPGNVGRPPTNKV